MAQVQRLSRKPWRLNVTEIQESTSYGKQKTFNLSGCSLEGIDPRVIGVLDYTREHEAENTGL